MGVREVIQKNPAITVGATLALAAGALAYSLRGGWQGQSTISTEAYYTVDEGKTVFVDTMDHIPPFDHDGKTAYRVWMFTTDGGKTKFPGYLERYTPEGKKKAEAQLAELRSGKSKGPPNVGPNDLEVRKPGAANPWVSRADQQEVVKVTHIEAPNGGEIELVMP